MIIFNRIIPILSGLIVWLWLFLIVGSPQLIYLFGAFLVISLIVLMLKMFNWHYRSKEFWAFLGTILWLLIGSTILLVFLDSVLLRSAFIIAVGILSGYYLNNIFQFLYNKNSYQVYSLENVSNYLNIISFFIFISAFFSLYIFFNYPVYFLMILTFILSWLIITQTLWVNKVDLKKGRLFVLIVAFLTTELFWTVHYLPTSFFVNGLILTIIYYLAINIGLTCLLEKTVEKRIFRTLVVGLSMLILLLVFAQWS